MKTNLLPSLTKTVWQNNKPFVFFILSFLLILSFLKIIFYNYNYHFLFSPADVAGSRKDAFLLIKWSLVYDLLVLMLINIAFLIAVQLARLVRGQFVSHLVLITFILLNSAVILLNVSDIFYFRFHFQRANADLLYVLSHPFRQLFHLNIFIIAAFLLTIAGIFFLNYRLHYTFFRSFSSGKRCGLATGMIVLGIILFPFYKKNIEKYLLPTYPLVELNSRQLPVVQNSFHTFAFSVLRQGEEVKLRNYLPVSECNATTISEVS